MKKLLVGLVVLGSFSSFAVRPEVTNVASDGKKMSVMMEFIMDDNSDSYSRRGYILKELMDECSNRAARYGKKLKELDNLKISKKQDFREGIRGGSDIETIRISGKCSY